MFGFEDELQAENKLLRRAIVGILEDISPAIDFEKDSVTVTLPEYKQKYADRLHVAQVDDESIIITFPEAKND